MHNPLGMKTSQIQNEQYDATVKSLPGIETGNIQQHRKIYSAIKGQKADLEKLKGKKRIFSSEIRKAEENENVDSKQHIQCGEKQNLNEKFKRNRNPCTTAEKKLSDKTKGFLPARPCKDTMTKLQNKNNKDFKSMQSCSEHLEKSNTNKKIKFSKTTNSSQRAYKLPVKKEMTVKSGDSSLLKNQKKYGLNSESNSPTNLKDRQILNEIIHGIPELKPVLMDAPVNYRLIHEKKFVSQSDSVKSLKENKSCNKLKLISIEDKTSSVKSLLSINKNAPSSNSQLKNSKPAEKNTKLEPVFWKKQVENKTKEINIEKKQDEPRTKEMKLENEQDENKTKELKHGENVNKGEFDEKCLPKLNKDKEEDVSKEIHNSSSNKVKPEIVGQKASKEFQNYVKALKNTLVGNQPKRTMLISSNCFVDEKVNIENSKVLFDINASENTLIHITTTGGEPMTISAVYYIAPFVYREYCEEIRDKLDAVENVKRCHSLQSTNVRKSHELINTLQNNEGFTSICIRVAKAYKDKEVNVVGRTVSMKNEPQQCVSNSSSSKILFRNSKREDDMSSAGENSREMLLNTSELSRNIERKNYKNKYFKTKSGEPVKSGGKTKITSDRWRPEMKTTANNTSSWSNKPPFTPYVNRNYSSLKQKKCNRHLSYCRIQREFSNIELRKPISSHGNVDTLETA